VPRPISLRSSCPRSGRKGKAASSRPLGQTAALRGARLAYLSGITLAILDDAGRGRLLAALASARKAGVQVAFDPNIRPALWPDAGVMRAALSQAAAGADIVLPSFGDEAQVFGDADPEATAQRYRAAGAGLVVAKDGPGGVVTLRDGAVRRHAVPAVLAQPVDTTAAGDSFNAGLVAALLQGAGLEEAVAKGASLAGRVIAAPGALVPQAVGRTVRVPNEAVMTQERRGWSTPKPSAYSDRH
jgi:2-dehydro-3-deoxygluconokinase